MFKLFKRDNNNAHESEVSKIMRKATRPDSTPEETMQYTIEALGLDSEVGGEITNRRGVENKIIQSFSDGYYDISLIKSLLLSGNSFAFKILNYLLTNHHAGAEALVDEIIADSNTPMSILDRLEAIVEEAENGSSPSSAPSGAPTSMPTSAPTTDEQQEEAAPSFYEQLTQGLQNSGTTILTGLALFALNHANHVGHDGENCG